MKIFNNISFYFFLTALTFSLFQTSTISYAQQEKAEKSIVVKDYTWGSGGMGRSAVLKDITLKNTSIHEFSNIEIELELYTKSDIPLGSLRGLLETHSQQVAKKHSRTLILA